MHIGMYKNNVKVLIIKLNLKPIDKYRWSINGYQYVIKIIVLYNEHID